MTCLHCTQNVFVRLARSFGITCALPKHLHSQLSPSYPRRARYISSRGPNRSLTTATKHEDGDSTPLVVPALQSSLSHQRLPHAVGREPPRILTDTNDGIQAHAKGLSSHMTNRAKFSDLDTKNDISFDRTWWGKTDGANVLERHDIMRESRPTTPEVATRSGGSTQEKWRIDQKQTKNRIREGKRSEGFGGRAFSQSRDIETLRPAREQWQIQKKALTNKFGKTGWQPRKRLSPDALDGIRALHAQDPEKYTTPVLADQFEVSPEAIRRILRSKWRPNDDEEEDRKDRWEKRGQKIWCQMSELGVKPPKKWRNVGAGEPGEVLSSRARLKLTENWAGPTVTVSDKRSEYTPLADRIL